MTTINLRDYYPWDVQDEYLEVSDEVAAVLRADKFYEAAYAERIRRNQAYYSLDCDDGIEYSVFLSEPTPQQLLERMETFARLCRALNSLQETQGRRIDACTLLGMSMTEVAKSEGASVAAVYHSIKRGLAAMKKFFEKI